MENNFVMENDESFDCLVIKPSSIKDISWHDDDYLKKILNINVPSFSFREQSMNSHNVRVDPIYSISTCKDNFVEVIAKNLEIAKYNIKNIHVKNEIIAEEYNYIYELMYVDLEKESDYHKEENEIASLIVTNGDKIYSNAILFKNYIPTTSNSMILTTVTKEDIERILYDRVHTKLVLWNGDEYEERRVIGDLNIFSKNFFEGETPVKVEIGFLMHNINIWYTDYELPFDKNKSICGDLVKKTIDKCIIFTMKSEEFRGNLTLDEVKKIIYLSKKMSNYTTPTEYTIDKNDNFGRKIIYNKYKVLDLMYNKYK